MENLNNNNRQAAKAAAKAAAAAKADKAAADKAAADKAAADKAAAEAKAIEAELSILLPSNKVEKTAIVTKRQELNTAVKCDVNGLGSMFTSLRRNKSETLAFLEDQKAKGKKIDVAKVRSMIYEGNFNLFRSYMTEEEKVKVTFTPNQTTAIFLRASLVETA